MTRKIFFDADLDVSPLCDLTIGIVGYGSQGRAQALNLRDSGFSPLIGVRPGKSLDKARWDGFVPCSVTEACRQADLIMVLTPDETHAEICRTHIHPHAKPEALVGFGAGLTVHFKLVQLERPRRAVLVAPKGPGEVLRQRFLAGAGIPALVASEDEDRESAMVAMAYAAALGCGRAGIVKTTFREEAVADLFGEQGVLCGGLVELMRLAFEVLVERGYSPEVAYIECVAEVEYMAALVAQVGQANLAEHVSSTAYYGGVTRGPRVINRETRKRLEETLQDIESGRFFREFVEFVRSGRHLGGDQQDLRLLEETRGRFRTGLKHDR